MPANPLYKGLCCRKFIIFEYIKLNTLINKKGHKTITLVFDDCDGFMFFLFEIIFEFDFSDLFFPSVRKIILLIG